MAKFFEKFPTREYNGVQCKLITTRTALSAETKKTYTAFYDIPVRDGDRPDTVSYQAYGDQYYDWLLYYANGIVDPYYQWCLDDESLIKTIEMKYGSLAEAQERIIFYRTKQQDATIDTAAYASLAPSIKKYWAAVTDDASGAILYYKRAMLEYTVNTNQLVVLTASIGETRIGSLQPNERVTQTTNGRVTASGQIVFNDGTTVTVGCVEGSFVPGTVIGASSEVSVSVGEVDILGYTIPAEERVFWEPISCYQYEIEQNERYRTIRALVPGAADIAAAKHEELLNG